MPLAGRAHRRIGSVCGGTSFERHRAVRQRQRQWNRATANQEHPDGSTVPASASEHSRRKDYAGDRRAGGCVTAGRLAYSPVPGMSSRAILSPENTVQEMRVKWNKSRAAMQRHSKVIPTEAARLFNFAAWSHDRAHRIQQQDKSRCSEVCLDGIERTADYFI